MIFRDLRESRQRYDSMMGELKRKESLIREMQQRLESSEGCKFLLDHIYFVERMCGIYDLKEASITAQRRTRRYLK